MYLDLHEAPEKQSSKGKKPILGFNLFHQYILLKRHMEVLSVLGY